MLIHKKDIKRLRVAHTVLAESPIKSLEFLYNGEQLVYNTNRQIHILSLFDSGPTSKSFTAKGGAGLCKFFDPRFVLHSTTTGVDILKLLDLDRKSYKIYYRGHAKEITSIDSSEKLIVSGSEDSSVRIWEPKVMKALKVMKFPSSTLVAFHPKGDDFAVAYNSSTIEIFSTRNFDEPSSKAQYKQVDGVEWTGIKFSEKGNLLLVTTNAELILIFDVVTKEELHNLRDYKNPGKEAIGACFAPESNFVFGGSIGGSVNVWSLKTSFKACTLTSAYEGPCHHVAFNPIFMNMATAGSCEKSVKLHLWNEKI